MNASRTPEQIEGDINNVRDRVDSTLETLEQRLDAKRLVGEGLNYVRNTPAVKYATTAAASARRAARQYPVPTAVAGAGLLGLIIWGLTSRLNSRTNRQGMRRMSDTAANWLSIARNSMKDSMDSTADTAVGSTAASTAASTANFMAESTRRARQQTRDAAGRAWRGIEHAGSEARTVVRKHPMAASAVGLAMIAIATAAAIPALRHRIGR